MQIHHDSTSLTLEKQITSLTTQPDLKSPSPKSPIQHNNLPNSSFGLRKYGVSEGGEQIGVGGVRAGRSLLCGGDDGRSGRFIVQFFCES
jgi:hypothetical protein